MKYDIQNFPENLIIHFRQRLTILKICLSLLVVTGLVFVVQPTFIFGNVEKLEQNFTQQIEDNQYSTTLGSIVGLICAFSAGVHNVAAAKEKDIDEKNLKYRSRQ